MTFMGHAIDEGFLKREYGATYSRRIHLRGEAAQCGHAIAGMQMPRGNRGPETLADLQIDRQLLLPIDFDGQCGSRYGHDGLAGKGSGERRGLVGSTILGTFQ